MRWPRSSKIRPSSSASELVRERRLPRRCSSSLACTASNSARSRIGSCSPGWLWALWLIAPKVDPVAQKMGERAVAEGHAADDFARGQSAPARDDAGLPQLALQGRQRAKREVTLEHQPDRGCFLLVDDELALARH